MTFFGFPQARRGKGEPRCLALLDGTRILLALALVADAARGLFLPGPHLLDILVRWPGGMPLPLWDGFLLGAALLVRHRSASVILAAHAVLAAIGIGEYYALRARGLEGPALPYSVMTLGILVAAVARTFLERGPGRWGWRALGAAGGSLLLILSLLFSFGTTEYSRPAEAIVVFGAGVDEQGNPSLALEDRMRHGIHLYEKGMASRLVLSGALDEVPAMERLAVRAGVPRNALVLDPAGVNSHATVANLKFDRIVAVSHYYHLARIKLTAGRRGIACATSPCPMSRRLAREPWYVARECAAIVAYYLFRG